MNSTLPTETIAAVVCGEYSSPFDVFGMHVVTENGRAGLVVRTFQPHAAAVSLVREGEESLSMTRTDSGGLFEFVFPDESEFFTYELEINPIEGQTYISGDPYRFPPVLSDFDLHLIAEGSHTRLYEKLGAHLIEHESVAGVEFAVWAPNAKRVSVVGDFNQWISRRHALRPRGGSGIWELFVPGMAAGELYKYAIHSNRNKKLVEKADPFGFAAELRPQTASRVFNIEAYKWNDAAWMTARPDKQSLQAPISVYEVHLGSWRHSPGGDSHPLTYKELSEQLSPM